MNAAHVRAQTRRRILKSPKRKGEFCVGSVQIYMFLYGKIPIQGFKIFQSDILDLQILDSDIVNISARTSRTCILM